MEHKEQYISVKIKLKTKNFIRREPWKDISTG